LEGGEEGKSLEEKRRLKGGEGGEETELETVAYYLTTTVPDHWLSKWRSSSKMSNRLNSQY